MLPAAERPNFRTSLFRYIPYGATCECSTASAYKCVHKVFRENVKPRVLLLSRRETIIVVSHLVRAILHQIAYHTHSHNMSYYSSKRTTSEKRNLKKKHKNKRNIQNKLYWQRLNNKSLLFKNKINKNQIFLKLHPDANVSDAYVWKIRLLYSC